MRFLLIALLLLTATACGRRVPETLITDYDEKEIAAAIERARREVDEFIKILEKGEGEEFAVKAKISQGENAEHFWLGNLKIEGDLFHGTIANEPGIVTNVKLGQPWQVKKFEISDWKYERAGKIYGGYTIDPLLKSMPPVEAAWWRERLVRP